MPDFNNSISKAMMAVDLTSESVTEISLSDKTRAMKFEAIEKFFAFSEKDFFSEKANCRGVFRQLRIQIWKCYIRIGLLQQQTHWEMHIPQKSDS